eukprot:7397000-Pyramimonas_sp.AAC.1
MATGQRGATVPTEATPPARCGHRRTIDGEPHAREELGCRQPPVQTINPRDPLTFDQCVEHRVP